MPVVVTDFKWKQTENAIIITVPLKGVHQSKVDIFTAPEYVKASYEKYFFEVLLLNLIDVDDSKCTLTSENIIFELAKVKQVHWASLELELTKQEKLEIKKKILEDEYQRIQEKDKEKRNKKSELKRRAVREQIALDTKQRELIETIRKEDKDAALGDFKSWKNKAVSVKIIEEKPILNKPRTKEVTNVTPKPRKRATIEVSFTERAFPTPCRESRLEEENEWLKKQAEARRSAGFVSEDLRPEEKNPQYVKYKGDEFMKAGNYLGAISAYSFGIKISPKLPDFYISRAEAQFIIGNYKKCAEDCSGALDLLQPPVAANLKERALCVGFRGMALKKLGMTKQGLEEIEIAKSISKKNEDVTKLLYEKFSMY